ncbi:MAG TPA: AAA domain-containing protein [Puia sp.]|nr:AAA domain-containing protein [Puia sp.]
MPAAHFATILKFWRSVETFTLPDIPGGKRSDHLALLRPGIPLPWEPGRLPAPRENRQWRHTLYFHVVAKETVIDLLARLTNSNDFREPVGGNTCLSALTLGPFGKPSARSYSPASFLYGIKLIREKRNPEVLADWLKKAHEAYLTRFGISVEQPEPPPLTWPQLCKELDHLQKIAGDALQTNTPVCCISEQVSLTTAADAPFLNSYFVNDLDNLIRHPHDIGAPLRRFLSAEPPLSERIDLLQPANLLQYIQHPPPPGRWPSDPRHSLYSAQYAALGIALGCLGPSAHSRQPQVPHPSPSALHRQAQVPHPSPSLLLAINGPPGTGKSTLLREIIANAVVTRARRLLAGRQTILFETKRRPISDRCGYYRPDPSIIANDGIVISGNNNGAIENISRQLPLAQTIHRDSFPDAEYFSPFATNVLGEPSWGLISAALGRSQKRSDFVDKFWFKGFGRWLKEQYEDETQAVANTKYFQTTAEKLRSLLQRYDRFTAIALAWSKDPSAQNTALLADEFALPPDRLPSKSYLHLSHTDRHRFTPFASEQLNTWRSDIFLCSLRLHEWAIRCNARYFYQNLGAFIDMLAGKWSDRIDSATAGELWNSFFFCVPVISVTLASFHRQFHNMGRESIGWLLLDEAGQATPASVCGALWRSRRCILIGDTRQIPPVVTIPRTLSRLLQDAYGIRDDTWSPLSNSAQSLADRVTPAGTRIFQDNTDPVWTGIPLRAHRRCEEPMFSIANTIAYDGQMVQAVHHVAPGAPATTVSTSELSHASLPFIPSGPSGWIDIRGFTVRDGHTIAEELLVVTDLLRQLTTYPGSVFIISPFRSVADTCREQFETARVTCGTIHTFQGKEADIVILVLGTLALSTGARNWVASSPNILNVAITRARHRIYVIGNRDTWSAHHYFDHLARRLPVKPHISGRLF